MPVHNLTDQMVHELGTKIVQGKIAPGEVLPKVEAISEAHGVSRTVIREALKGLGARGLVNSVPKVGTIVCPRSDWQWWDPDMLSWAVDGDQNRDFFLQLTEVRLAIEPYVTALAAKNATDEDIAAIKASYEQLEKSVDSIESWSRADYAFHNSIFTASKNELLINLSRLLHDSLLRSRELTMKTLVKDMDVNILPALNNHKEILDAICNRDQEAAHQKMHALIVAIGEIIQTIEEE